MIIAGIDEAGYGPLLGPLVVSAALFRVPDRGPAPSPTLRERLEPLVRRTRRGVGIPVDDSKKLYTSGKGLRALEEGIYPFLLQTRREIPRSLRELLGAVARRDDRPPDAYLDRYPWYAQRRLELPRDTFRPYLARLAGQLATKLESRRVEVVALASLPLEVAELNACLAGGQNKSAVSASLAGNFVARLWRRFPDEDVELIVDRQGGRTHYAPWLFEITRPRGVVIEEQGAERCAYRLSRRRNRGAPGGAFRVEFVTASEERHLAVALASMLSKYVRELHMILFNEYWAAGRKNLRPTAGYVQDGRRFLADIAGARQRLRIDDALLIRRR